MKKILTQVGLVLGVYLFLPLCFMSVEAKGRPKSTTGIKISLLPSTFSINQVSTFRTDIDIPLSDGQSFSIPAIGLSATNTELDSILQIPSALAPINFPTLLSSQQGRPVGTLSASLAASTIDGEGKIALLFSLITLGPDGQIVNRLPLNGVITSVPPAAAGSSSWVTFTVSVPSDPNKWKKIQRRFSGPGYQQFLQVSRNNQVDDNHQGILYLLNLALTQ